MAPGMSSGGSAADMREGITMHVCGFQPDQTALHCRHHLVVGCLQQGVPGQLPPDRRQVCDGERDGVWSIDCIFRGRALHARCSLPALL